MLRHPAVAGHFYHGSAEALRKQVQECILPDATRVRALGLLSPHAGLMYSGSVAGAVYSNVELPDTFVLIGPNHTGMGAPISLMASGRWETPLGGTDINESLAAAILAKSSRIHEDTLAHLREHSLEVQLPFIQYFKEKFTIVPIQMLDVRLESCLEVGRAVAGAIKERREQRAEGRGQETEVRRQESEVKSQEIEEGKLQPETRNSQSAIDDVLIVASSDMSHYEPAVVAKEKDHKAIHHILNLDPEGLYRTVRDSGITMCGFGPTVAMLTACKMLGATRAELIKYTNSGEASGDYAQVVGYAGIVVM